MRKRLFSSFIAGLFLINLFGVVEVKTVLAETTTAQVNKESFNASDDSIIANEIIVKYKNEESGSKMFNYFFGSKNTEEKIGKIVVDNKEQLDQKVEELKKDSNVKLIQPNYKYQRSNVDYTGQKNMVRAMSSIATTTNQQWHLNNLCIPDLWTQSTGSNVTIAVIDSGIDVTHEELANKVIGGKDFTDSGSDTQNGAYLDTQGNGTLVAGVIAADRANNTGVSGIAYDSKLLSVKVFGGNKNTDTMDIVNAIKWSADNGAKILNINAFSRDNDPLLKEAVNYAVAKGCIIVAAAGNVGFMGVCYPAAYDNVISVGTTNEANQWCYYSAYGKKIDLVAPGTNIYSTAIQANNPTKYDVGHGTAMSAAIVSAEIALILSKQPQLKTVDIQNKIKTTSYKLATNSPDPFYGYGFLDVKKILTNVATQFKITGTSSVDDNTATKASYITKSETRIGHLSGSADSNWYKIHLQPNTVVKLSLSNVSSNLFAQIFSNDFNALKSYLSVTSTGEYYLSNYCNATDYYVSVVGKSSNNVDYTIAMQYLSGSDASIPRDGTFKASIDSPALGANFTDDNIEISGWAISKNGINKLQARLDNKPIELEYGRSRPDVAKAYPDYNNSQCGFSRFLDIRDLPYGTHQLTLMSISQNGVVTLSNTITFTNSSTLKTNIETVAKGTNIQSGFLTVNGWALSKAGIRRVEAVIDNDPSVALTYGQGRIDVYNANRDYENTNSGFSGVVNITKYSYGSHTVKLKIVYSSGRVDYTAPITFSISSVLKTSVDNVKDGDVITSDTLGIGGWAISESGVSKVEAIIDNNTPVAMTYGGARADVYNSFPDYNNKNSGFNGIVNLNGLTLGEHILKIRVTEVNGNISIPNQVKIIVNSAICSIDTPSVGKEVTGKSLSVAGWALSKAGIQKIEAMVDGTVYKELQYNLSRPDVYNAYKNYNNPTSGYGGTIDISKLSYGAHNIQVKITNKNGCIYDSTPVAINVTDAKQYTIDSPQNGLTLTGKTLNVSGWSLSMTGITKVEALIDGVPQAVPYNISRPDVYNAYKEFNNKSSGFGGTVDISKVTFGSHSFAMRFTDARGSITVSEPAITFKVDNTLIYSIDAPAKGATIAGSTLYVGGWAISKANVTKVEAVIDGVAQALTYGGGRPDVYNAYKDYNNQTSGYSGTVDISKLSAGNHTLVVRFTDGNGRITNSEQIKLVK